MRPALLSVLLLACLEIGCWQEALSSLRPSGALQWHNIRLVYYGGDPGTPNNVGICLVACRLPFLGVY